MHPAIDSISTTAINRENSFFISVSNDRLEHNTRSAYTKSSDYHCDKLRCSYMHCVVEKSHIYKDKLICNSENDADNCKDSLFLC